jgi:hypothetical protein
MLYMCLRQNELWEGKNVVEMRKMVNWGVDDDDDGSSKDDEEETKNFFLL